MQKFILKDNTEINIADGASLGAITAMVNTFSDLENLRNVLNKKGNLDTVQFVSNDNEYSEKYANMKLARSSFYEVDMIDGKVHATFAIREKTESEKAADNVEQQKSDVYTALTFLTDEEALTVKALHKPWEDDPEGYHYSIENPLDLRRQYNERLWKLKKDHNKQASWYPGAEATLWEEIIEGHAGTLEDPIPVPDSVTTSGFTYVYGKYYLENGEIYLCKRGGVDNPEEMYGKEETLNFPPSQLVGQYFEKVNEM